MSAPMTDEHKEHLRKTYLPGLKKGDYLRHAGSFSPGGNCPAREAWHVLRDIDGVPHNVDEVSEREAIWLSEEAGTRIREDGDY